MLTSDSSARSSRTSILIVADVRLYREGMGSSLATCARLTVVGTCASRADAREQVARLHPDVVVLDVATRESLELIRDLRADAPRTKVLAFALEENAADIIDCAESGAAGFVTAEASIDDLVAAIEGIVRAELVCSPRIAAQLFGRISERRERWSFDAKTLTTREREVLDHISQGKSNKEIAQKLNIAEPTVKNHVHNLLDKLEVTTRAQAAARVLTRRAIAGRPTLAGSGSSFDLVPIQSVAESAPASKFRRLVDGAEANPSAYSLTQRVDDVYEHPRSHRRGSDNASGNSRARNLE